jgi:hypothetical protein
VSPVATAGTECVSIGLLPVGVPFASNKRCSVRDRPRASKFSVAKPRGLITPRWQLAHTVPPFCVSCSTTWRVVMSGESCGGTAFAPGGGGGISSHSTLRRMKTPFMIGRVFAEPDVKKSARVKRPGRAPSANEGGVETPSHAGRP